MSGSQKALKIISIVLIAWALVTILFGALMAAGSAVPGMSVASIDMNGTAVDMATAAIALGVGIVINGVFSLVIALFGLRGAKNPRKVGAFLVLCVIGVALGLVGIGMSIAQGAFQWTSLVSLALIVVCTVLASNIKKQA